MTDEQRIKIATLREQGFGYATIANAVGLKKDTVASYCRRNNLSGIKAEDNSRINLHLALCLNCGRQLVQTPGRKRKKFCSENCRRAWWNNHLDQVNRKAVYSYACAGCGKTFTAYGNAGRKYCCHQCYVSARFGKECSYGE